MMKKLVALLMALAMLCSSIAAFAEPTDPATHEGPHTPDGAGTVVSEATCTKPGQIQYTCSVCKKTYTVETELAKHEPLEDYAIDSQAPTCSAEGWKEYTCKNCKQPFKVTIDKLDHDTETKVIDATCTEPKTLITTCKNCDYSVTATEGEKLGHVWSNSSKKVIEDAGLKYDPDKDLTVKVTVPATCKDAGSIANYYYCLRCGAYSDEKANTVEELDKLEHDFDEFFTYRGEGDDKVCVGGKDNAPINVGDKEVDTYLSDITDQGEVIHYEAKAPTCTEDGFVRVTCTICGETKEEPLKTPGHAWGEKVDEHVPNCVTDGKEVYECSVCHATYQTTIKCRGGHVFDEENGSRVVYLQKNFFDKKAEPVDTPYLCNSYIKRVYCNQCDASEDHQMPATEKHTPGITLEEVAPTCTEAGHKLYQCRDCKQPVWDDIKANGHDWDKGVITTAATCTEDGVKTYTCKECGETKTEVIPTAGHTKIVVDSKPATCTLPGYYKETCAACKKVLVDKILPITHKYDLNNKAQILDYTPATCTVNGEISYYCSLCHTLVEDQVIEAEGHDWNKGTTVEPTCEHDGTITKTCKVCKEQSIEHFGEIQPHTFDKEKSTVIPYVLPTCTEDGLSYYSCAVCGKMDKKVENKLEHDFYKADGTLNIVWNGDENQFVLKCTREGCGYVKTIEVHEPEYTIGTKDGKGTITLKEDCQALSTVYVRIMWRYKFASGESFAYVDCRPVTLSDDLKTGTFKITGGQAGSAILVATCVEVVTDPDADSKIMGSYTNYGADIL